MKYLDEDYTSLCPARDRQWVLGVVVGDYAGHHMCCRQSLMQKLRAACPQIRQTIVMRVIVLSSTLMKRLYAGGAYG